MKLTQTEQLALENLSLKRQILSLEEERILRAISKRIGIQRECLASVNYITGEIAVIKKENESSVQEEK